MLDQADSGRKRLVSGLLAAALQAGLMLGLLFGLAAPAMRFDASPALIALDLRLPPPNSAAPLPPARATRPMSRAAAPARHAQAAPVVAPPAVPLIASPQIVAAPLPGLGLAPSAGSAAAGAGSGAGGLGNGMGAGGTDGDGAALVSGRIKPSDTPGALFDAPFSGTTRALVLIDARGAVADCRTLRSSGSPALDALTCRLISTRFRFRAARDPAGRPVPGQIIYEHDWEVGGGFASNPPR